MPPARPLDPISVPDASAVTFDRHGLVIGTHGGDVLAYRGDFQSLLRVVGPVDHLQHTELGLLVAGHRTLASRSTDGTVVAVEHRLIRLTSAALSSEGMAATGFGEHGYEVVAYRRDGTWLRSPAPDGAAVALGPGGHLRVWVATRRGLVGQRLSESLQPAPSHTNLEFVATRPRLAATLGPGGLALWRLTSPGEPAATWRRTRARVLSVALAEDGHRLAVLRSHGRGLSFSVGVADARSSRRNDPARLSTGNIAQIMGPSTVAIGKGRVAWCTSRGVSQAALRDLGLPER